jgi:hypothetical protein
MAEFRRRRARRLHPMRMLGGIDGEIKRNTSVLQIIYTLAERARTAVSPLTGRGDGVIRSNHRTGRIGAPVYRGVEVDDGRASVIVRSFGV